MCRRRKFPYRWRDRRLRSQPRDKVLDLAFALVTNFGQDVAVVVSRQLRRQKGNRGQRQQASVSRSSTIGNSEPRARPRFVRRPRAPRGRISACSR